MNARTERRRKRNAAILKRYWYLVEKKRLRFDDAIRILAEKEFFLSEFQVIQIIKNELKSTDNQELSSLKVPSLQDCI